MLLIGDVREAMGKETQRNIVNTIERNTKKDSYYLLAVSDYVSPESIDIQTKIILLSEKPPKMLGSLCLYVNNRTGEIRREWILPFDRPFTQQVDGSANEGIFYDAKGMPIVHS